MRTRTCRRIRTRECTAHTSYVVRRTCMYASITAPRAHSRSPSRSRLRFSLNPRSHTPAEMPAHTPPHTPLLRRYNNATRAYIRAYIYIRADSRSRASTQQPHVCAADTPIHKRAHSDTHLRARACADTHIHGTWMQACSLLHLYACRHTPIRHVHRYLGYAHPQAYTHLLCACAPARAFVAA